MFFKKKPDPKKMDAMAETIAAFMKMSIAAIEKNELTEVDEVVIDCFLFGIVDFMAHSNKMRDTSSVSKIVGLVLVKYMAVGTDQAWSRLESMVSMSNETAGQFVMRQGGQAFQDFARSQDPRSVLVLNDIVSGDYFSAEPPS